MKIINIQPQLTPKYNINRYQTKPQQETQNLPKYEGKLPSTQQYLAFMGGASLNLAQTVKKLDKLVEKNSRTYPPNIREWLGFALEERSKKTLIGVHKDYFSSLKKDFITLDEIKAKFPEFQDVVPAMNIKAKEGSFIDKFQKGELEFFDNDEDLSIQLIKLYWGEGFSLNDLKRYAGGTDLYHTMKKLGIPRVSKDYGHYLKFSDPQYNERLTAKMTEKRLAALDRRAQLQEGEPVHIPRGPLSEQHKQRISEGLNRYHEEHPETVYQMSERRKEFYRQNPDRAEELTRVLKKAWGIRSGENIRKAMSRFFKSKKVPMFNPEEPAKMTKNQSRVMGEFWNANPWAKKSFSKAMEYGWKKVKEENVKFYELDLTPDKFKEKFYEWAGKKGLDLSNLDFKFKIYQYKPELDSGNGMELSKYTPHFIDEYSDATNSDRSRVLANTYLLTLINVSKELKKIVSSPKTNLETKVFLDTIRIFIRDSLFEPGSGLYRQIKTFNAQEAQNIYRNILLINIQLPNSQKYLDMFHNELNNAYNIIDKQPNDPVILTKEMLEGVLK